MADGCAFFARDVMEMGMQLMSNRADVTVRGPTKSGLGHLAIWANRVHK